MFLKKSLAFLLGLFILLSLPVLADGTRPNSSVVTEYASANMYKDVVVPTSTIPMSTVPKVDAKSFVLMEASTGKIMASKDENEKVYPASITKVMTMLLVVEAIKEKKISLKDSVAVSEHAASMGGSQIWLEVGETMTVHEMLKAVAVGSANDASVALAELIGGSEEGFVAMMNNRAKELGMKNTNFNNACGLDVENHFTSAKDVAIMSAELIQHDMIKKYTTIWMDSLRNCKTELVNTNKLVRFYMGSTGLKTGTTNDAGFCLTATANREGMELVSVVMKAKSSDERFGGAKKLLNYGFANWCITKPKFDKNQLVDIKVKRGELDSVPVEIEEINNQLIKLGERDKITTKLEMNQEIAAPFEKGSQVGKLIILIDSKPIGEYKVLTKNDCKEISFGFTFVKLLSLLLKL